MFNERVPPEMCRVRYAPPEMCREGASGDLSTGRYQRSVEGAAHEGSWENASRSASDHVGATTGVFGGCLQRSSGKAPPLEVCPEGAFKVLPGQRGPSKDVVRRAPPEPFPEEGAFKDVSGVCLQCCFGGSSKVRLEGVS